MSSTQVSKSYRELVERTRPSNQSPGTTQESELDALVHELKDRDESAPGGSNGQPTNPIQRVRDIMVSELMPAFIELVEKYSRTGVKMEMDASDLLSGGREVSFAFSLGEHQLCLYGTVTTEAIAFHEVRRAPDVHGELASGPMLRLRGLGSTTFREFICERLCVLMRAVMKHR